MFLLAKKIKNCYVSDKTEYKDAAKNRNGSRISCTKCP